MTYYFILMEIIWKLYQCNPQFSSIDLLVHELSNANIISIFLYPGLFNSDRIMDYYIQILHLHMTS